MTGRQFLQAALRISRVLPLVVGVILVLNLAAYFLISTFLIPRNQSSERSVLTKQRQVRSAQQRAGEIITPQKDYFKKEQEIQTFRESLPPKTDFTGLIRELFVLSSAAGLDIDQIKYAPKQLETEGILEYGVSFDITGRYAQLKRFIFELEQSPRVLIIDEIVLTKRGEADQENVGLRIQLTTFFREEGA